MAIYGEKIPARLTPRGLECLDTALLLTCRQIHTEAALLLYSTNTFMFASLSTLLRFMTYRAFDQRRAILYLALRTWRGLHFFDGNLYPVGKEYKALKVMSNLRHIHLANRGRQSELDRGQPMADLRLVASLLRRNNRGLKVTVSHECWDDVGKVMRATYLGSL